MTLILKPGRTVNVGAIFIFFRINSDEVCPIWEPELLASSFENDLESEFPYVLSAAHADPADITESIIAEPKSLR